MSSKEKNSGLPYRYIIGLEIHVELATKTKMFCRCLNAPFGAEPNQHICPICTGLPGTLPVPNLDAVKRTIMVGKALGSQISSLSKWDRKHYFYPDLPKGYQISQYDLPLCVGGELELLDKDGNISSKIRFERVHLEEDAGKLMHTGNPGYSKVDLNRAGVPLIEMVTKPDLTSPEQARAFMQELRLLMRTLGVSDADMEKGQMRCDVNVNISFEYEGQTVKTPITEIKNVNSTRAVERSLIVEAGRQYEEWLANGPIRTRKNKLTAGWDEDKNLVTISRAKEEANDYRYFPEPDIPPLKVYEMEELNPNNITLPLLPNQSRRRYLEMGLSMPDIEIFLNDPARQELLEKYLETGLSPKQVSNWLINLPESAGLSHAHFQELVKLVADGLVGFAAAKAKFADILAKSQSDDKRPIKDIGKELGLLTEHDEGAVGQAVKEVLAEQAKAVQDYRDGKQQIMGFLVGQVIKKASGKAQPALVQERLKSALEEKK